MKNYSFLLLLLLPALMVTPSCVFKALKKEQEEVKKLTEKHQQIEKDIINKQNAWEASMLNLQKCNDSLRAELAKVKVILPKDLLLAKDSLQQELSILRGSHNTLRSENVHLKDTLRRNKTVFRNLFSVPGNKAYTISHNKNTYDCYEVDLKQANLQLYWKNEQGVPLQSLSNLDKMLTGKRQTLVFAANAGMYTPEHAPQGLFIKDRKVVANLDRKKDGYGNFYMQPNGVFVIDTNNMAAVVKTEQFNEQVEKAAKFATQSGPIVVIDSLINTNFKQGSDNLNIRNGVGVLSPNKVVFIISNQRVNFYDFAEVFRKLKCRNALYLDGSISETYLPELGRFENGGNFGPIIGIIK